MSEIQRCPFCGGEAELTNEHGEYFVQCTRMGTCYGKHDLNTEGYFHKEDAVAGWNHRVSSPAVARLAETSKRLRFLAGTDHDDRGAYRTIRAAEFDEFVAALPDGE